MPAALGGTFRDADVVTAAGRLAPPIARLRVAAAVAWEHGARANRIGDVKAVRPSKETEAYAFSLP